MRSHTISDRSWRRLKIVFKIIACSYFVVSFLLLVAIHVPLYAENPLVHGIFCYLGLPAAVLCFGVTYYFRDRLHPDVGAIKTWICSVLLWLFALLFLFPYGIAVNALAGPASPITLQGTITRKEIGGGKTTTYSVDFWDSNLNQNMSCSVSKRYFDNARIGDFYSEEFLLGRFGIPYRWTWQKL